MGQITNPIVKGITVLNVDRQTGPAAGAGQTGNNVLLLGANTGLNSTAANLVILGSNSGDAGIPATLSGTTIVGAQSLPSLTAATGGPGSPAGMTVLGQGNAPLLTTADSTVMIGQGILPLLVSQITTSVLIGNGVGSNINATATAYSNNVAIGYKAMSYSAATGGGIQNMVVIGSLAMSGVAGANQSSVIIGHNAGNSVSGASTCVFIGDSTSGNGSGSGNVLIGASITITTVNAANNTAIGNSVAAISGSNNVLLGQLAKVTANAANVRSISIGSAAGRTLPATLSNILCIETNDTADAQRAMIYGDMRNGNIVLGNSTDAASRDLISAGTATNTLRLLNGTIAAANPASGGYFYVSGGILNWVDQNGIASQLSESVQGQLVSSALNAFSNNAAANVGTLTNSPTTGNPTKWIPINDAGTIRNIPAW